MDIERKIELVTRPPTEEIIFPDELRQLLEREEHPVAYNGFEPSGHVHIGIGLVCSYKMKDFIEAGFDYRVYLATWHAWINNKLGGKMDLIKKAAKLLEHAFYACGIPRGKVKFIHVDEVYDDIKYWELVIRIARELTILRTIRTLEIAGRKETEAKKVADLIYTPMQVADIFHFGIKVCQLGMDQRKANIVAREIGPKLGFWKPICVHHHLLLGLEKPKKWPLPKEPTERKEAISEVKMSKSKPAACIFVYDEPATIKDKIAAAFCPPKDIEYNPILDICKYIIFREKKEFVIERPTEYGGKVEFSSYAQLEKEYAKGTIHPTDLKAAVTQQLIEILAPVREYFAKNREAAELKDLMYSLTITR